MNTPPRGVGRLRTSVRSLASLLLAGLASASAIAGPLEDGVEAFKRNDFEAALTLLMPLAEHGNAQAEAFLGTMYLGGMAVPEDLPAGLEWERKAADQGEVIAQVQLGRAYQQGRGVKQDYAEAMKWFLEASAQGDSVAQISIAEMYAHGQGVPKDQAEAEKWRDKSLRRPRLPRELVVGLAAASSIFLYSLQPYGGPDLPEWDFHGHHVLGHLALGGAQARIAVKALDDAVAAGIAGLGSMCAINPRHALRFKMDGDTFDVLICYECGQLEVFKNDLQLPFSGMINGMPEVLNGLLKAGNIPLADNPVALNESYAEEAKSALKKAHEGDAKAQEVMAHFLISGRGVKKDDAEGIKWLAQSLGSPLDSPEFQIKLGRMHLNGREVSQNFSEAMRLFQKAAVQGSAEAEYQIGELYDLGIGVARNPAEAIKHFRQAAENGNPKAQYEIGVLYAQGKGVKQDYREALKWLRKAVEEGHPGALSWMGSMYEEGSGVTKDLVEAYFWNRLATAYGTMPGGHISVKLTPERLAVINKRVADWTAAHPKRPAGWELE